jgi:isoprenylcysteine carboxyl methyltransferase (ICMT) family protein YpbQ
MKNIKWHKFFIVGLFIWVANSITTIKLNRVTTIGVVLLIATLFMSCSSCKIKRYWKTHRCVEVQHKKDNIPTFKTSGKIAVR